MNYTSFVAEFRTARATQQHPIFKTETVAGLGIVFNRQRQVDICDLETSLVYIVS